MGLSLATRKDMKAVRESVENGFARVDSRLSTVHGQLSTIGKKQVIMDKKISSLREDHLRRILNEEVEKYGEWAHRTNSSTWRKANDVAEFLLSQLDESVFPSHLADREKRKAWVVQQITKKLLQEKGAEALLEELTGVIDKYLQSQLRLPPESRKVPQFVIDFAQSYHLIQQTQLPAARNKEEAKKSKDLLGRLSIFTEECSRYTLFREKFLALIDPETNEVDDMVLKSLYSKLKNWDMLPDRVPQGANQVEQVELLLYAMHNTENTALSDIRQIDNFKKLTESVLVRDEANNACGVNVGQLRELMDRVKALRKVPHGLMRKTQALWRAIGMCRSEKRKGDDLILRELDRDDRNRVFMMCLIHAATKSHTSLNLIIPKAEVEVDIAGKIVISSNSPPTAQIHIAEIKSSSSSSLIKGGKEQLEIAALVLEYSLRACFPQLADVERYGYIIIFKAPSNREEEEDGDDNCSTSSYDSDTTGNEDDDEYSGRNKKRRRGGSIDGMTNSPTATQTGLLCKKYVVER